MSDEKPTITFGPSAAETVLEEVGGWTVDENGFIKDGERYAEAYDGMPIRLNEFAGVELIDGEKELIRDEFNAIVASAKRRRSDTEAHK